MTQNKYNKGDQVQIANGDWFTIEGYYETLEFGKTHVDLEGLAQTFDLEMLQSLITDHRPAFDWGTVKNGDCFKVKDSQYEDDVFYFIGADPLDDNLVVLSYSDSSACEYFSKDQITLYPDCDMEV